MCFHTLQRYASALNSGAHGLLENDIVRKYSWSPQKITCKITGLKEEMRGSALSSILMETWRGNARLPAKGHQPKGDSPAQVGTRDPSMQTCLGFAHQSRGCCRSVFPCSPFLGGPSLHIQGDTGQMLREVSLVLCCCVLLLPADGSPASLDCRQSPVLWL